MQNIVDSENTVRLWPLNDVLRRDSAPFSKFTSPTFIIILWFQFYVKVL